jgi:hypothetical protein
VRWPWGRPTIHHLSNCFAFLLVICMSKQLVDSCTHGLGADAPSTTCQIALLFCLSFACKNDSWTDACMALGQTHHPPLVKLFCLLACHLPVKTTGGTDACVALGQTQHPPGQQRLTQLVVLVLVELEQDSTRRRVGGLVSCHLQTAQSPLCL